MRSAADPGCPAGKPLRIRGEHGLRLRERARFAGRAHLLTAWARSPDTTTLAAAPTSTSEGDTRRAHGDRRRRRTNGNAVGGNGGVRVPVVPGQRQHPDLSWTIGTAANHGRPTVTSGHGIRAVNRDPAGHGHPADQAVDVVAMYGGDATHLPSRSAAGPHHVLLGDSVRRRARRPSGGKHLDVRCRGGVAPYAVADRLRLDVHDRGQPSARR